MLEKIILYYKEIPLEALVLRFLRSFGQFMLALRCFGTRTRRDLTHIVIYCFAGGTTENDCGLALRASQDI